MKKPPGLTKEQWANYKKAVDLAVDTMSKSLDLIAEANFRAGEINERERIIKLLKALYPNETWTGYIEKQIKGEQK